MVKKNKSKSALKKELREERKRAALEEKKYKETWMGRIESSDFYQRQERVFEMNRHKIPFSDQAEDAVTFRSIFWSLVLLVGFLVSWLLGIITLFLIATIAFYIYDVGLRDKDENEETPSAYSVFNKGAKRVAGSFGSESLDNALGGKMK